MGAAANRAVKEHGAPALVWRWFSGHPLDGHHRTDATWFGKGRKQIHHIGRPISRWHYRPRIQRAGIRSGVTWGLGATGYGLLVDPTLTEASMAGAASLGLSVACWRAVLGIRNWNHHRKFVEPLHVALAPRLGLDPAVKRPQEWLEIPRNFSKQDKEQRLAIALPKDFSNTSEAKKVIAEVAGAKLGLEDVKVSFEMLGVAPKAVITLSVPPPAKVLSDQLIPLMEKAPETKPVIGIGRNRQVVDADLEGESPHILISAGPGGGKSELTGLLTTQILHHGGVAMILDSKRTSHQWAKGLPNVKYCRNIEEIHEALISLKDELDRRARLVEELSDINGDLPADVNIGPRMALIFEEANTTVPRLQAYWRKIKQKGDPAVSPAIEAWNEYLFMGRAMKQHAIGIGQRMDSTATGGANARECFDIRCLARYQPQTWRILNGNMPMPRKTKHVGRWQIVTDAPREVQGGYLTNQEKREWALSGVVTPFPDLSAISEHWTQPVAALPDSQIEIVSDSLGGEPGNLSGEPQGRSLHVVRDEEAPGLVSLREAVESGIVPISLDAIRKARTENPEFPPKRGQRGKDFLYNAEELRRWEANRERNQDDEEAS